MLPDLVYSYNHSVHCSIKTKPVDVTVDNEKKVWHTLYDDDNVKNVKYKFKIGDQARISKIKKEKCSFQFLKRNIYCKHANTS